WPELQDKLHSHLQILEQKLGFQRTHKTFREKELQELTNVSSRLSLEFGKLIMADEEGNGKLKQAIIAAEEMTKKLKVHLKEIRSIEAKLTREDQQDTPDQLLPPAMRAKMSMDCKISLERRSSQSRAELCSPAAGISSALSNATTKTKTTFHGVVAPPTAAPPMFNHVLEAPSIIERQAGNGWFFHLALCLSMLQAVLSIAVLLAFAALPSPAGSAFVIPGATGALLVLATILAGFVAHQLFRIRRQYPSRKVVPFHGKLLT
ncbi:unnamed protein product, partial [Polarella glacialis]